jgi:hypothetical protein
MDAETCESWRMRKGIEVRLARGDRHQLERVVSNRSSPQKHVWRARIVLMTADGYGRLGGGRKGQNFELYYYRILRAIGIGTEPF